MQRRNRWLAVLALVASHTSACEWAEIAADASVPEDGAAIARDGEVVEDATVDGAVDPHAPLGPLPPAATASSDRFRTSDQCAFCHAAGTGAALRDGAGRDVSPVHEYGSSMMAFSARDPYWLAAFSHELAEQPAGTAVIEATCTRCHMPAASVESALVGDSVHFDDILSNVDPIATLGRDGATCTVCHQIQPDGLGTSASFTGGYVIDDSRQVFGPYSDPFAVPMQRRVGYTPTGGAHMTESALCATCHTVITRALDVAGVPSGPEFPEQVPYLEWRNSDYRTEGVAGSLAASCQDCHMPRTDDDGAAVTTAISTRPDTLAARTPFGRHTLLGGNAQMLAMLAEETAWAGAGDPASLRSAAEQTRDFVRRAADVAVRDVSTTGDELRFAVRVRNLSGHRFPTAYPSRRAWLHVRVLDAGGATLFESGALDARGALVDSTGARLDDLDAELPHRTEISAPDQVQVYRTRFAGADGAPTHVLLRATHFISDNRILPIGWSPTHPDAALTSPVGTEGDLDFVPGSDDVAYRIHAAGAARIEVRLLFQTIPPDAVEGVAHSPAGARLDAMVATHPQGPVLVAEASVVVP